MERVRYDLLLVINTLTLAVICNSAVWAVLLRVSAHQHPVPFLGIQPSNVPTIGSLEQIADLMILRIVTRMLPCRFFIFWGGGGGASSGHETFSTKYVPSKGPFLPNSLLT